MASSRQASRGSPKGAAQRGHGGTLSVPWPNTELPVSRFYEQYSLDGPGTIIRLTPLPRGTIFWLKINSALTFANSAAVICPNGMDYNAGAGDLVLARSSGDGVYRIFGFRATATPARADIYAAPFDSLAFSGMQVNGSMDVSQEFGSLAATALTSNAAMKYIIDSWGARFKSSGFSLFCQQVPSSAVACPAGFGNWLQIKASAGGAVGATDYAFVSTFFEGNRVARADFGKSTAQPVTVGFWAMGTVPGTMSVALLNGPGSRKIGAAVVINSANTPEYKTVTFAGDTTATGWTYDNTPGLQINFGFAIGSGEAALSTWSGSGSVSGCLQTSNFFATTNNAVYIGGVVVVPGLEVPAAARSPFIMRPFDTELVLCQRQFRSSWDYGTAPGTPWTAGLDQMKFNHPTSALAASWTFPGMRAAGTITVHDHTGAAGVITYFNGAWTAGGAYGTLYAKQNMAQISQFISGAFYTNFGYKIDARL